MFEALGIIMIEAKINVPREIIIDGLVKSRTIKTVLSDLSALASFYLLAWSVVIFVDVLTNNLYLIWWHFLALAFLVLIMTLYADSQAIKKIKSTAKNSEYTAKLDDSGVYINYPDKHHGWDEYEYYKEHDEYLEIKGKTTGITFLPKTNELIEVVKYTKTKIPYKVNSHG
jgi:hypothetical protein